VLTVALPEARKLASGVVAGQAVITLGVALAAYAIAGSLAARSAAIGGGISTTATLILVVLAFRRAAADPRRVARDFFVGEAAKVAVMITLFAVVLKFVNISAGALFAGFVATFFVYWLALANALPAFGAPRTGSFRVGAGDV
jgi:F0F1-type ATP synthase assembly protein I